MRRTLRFRATDDERVLLEEDTLAYGLHAGYERLAVELAVEAGTQVRLELLDEGDHLLDRRTYVAVEPARELSSAKPAFQVVTGSVVGATA
jgi:hypothetical protein